MTQRLEDRYGRVATDLRVSLTDRCNLRCTYCMPAEGLDWLPDRPGAHRRRGRPADRASASSASASARCASPAASRWCAAAWSTSCAAPRALEPRPRDFAHHQRARPGPHRAAPSPRPGLDRVNVSLDTRAPGDVPRRSPGATGSHDVRGRPRGGPGRRAAARSRSTPCCCAASTTTRRPSCCAGASSAATSCASSSRCRSTPSTAGAATAWSPPTRSSTRLERRVRPRARPRSRGAARPPSCSSSTAAPATVGRHRLGHPPVLRRLRPGPAHRRRPGPQLPVRPRGVRPAGGAARPAPTDEEIADRWVVAMRGKRRRPRHRRPDLPAARPADVGHRRLSAGSRVRLAEPASRAARGVRDDVLEERRGRRGSPRATAGARRTRARPCGGRGCAASGCSTAAPTRRRRWQPLAEQTVGVVVGSLTRRVRRGNGVVPDSHGGSRPAPRRAETGETELALGILSRATDDQTRTRR